MKRVADIEGVASMTEGVPPINNGGRRQPILLWAFLGVGAVLCGLMGWRSFSSSGRVASLSPLETLPVVGHIPDFALIERSGKPITLDDLRGHVWVADFVFTHCAGPCPLMSSTMARLQAALARQPEIRFVSITVDPERDTPEVLRGYADRYGADPTRWWFLTGPVETIKSLAIDGFKVGSIEDPILHSTHFVLVDAGGAIRGYFDSTEPNVLQRLTAAIDRLNREVRN